MSITSTLQETSHVRLNILSNEWILVSPHRAKRPWSGQVEKEVEEETQVMQNNPLAPGSLRNGIPNPMYKETYAFDNDFPALSSPSQMDSLQELSCEEAAARSHDGNPGSSSDGDLLFQSKAVNGKCRVICFHPNPRVSLPLMSIDEIDRVIEKWQQELKELSQNFKWVQVFENKGHLMGCSNPHPHCQVWATSFLPNEVVKEKKSQEEYFEKTNKVLLEEYRDRELCLSRTLKNNEMTRIVIENDFWVVLIPYWAAWPFETLLLPKSRIARLTEITPEERKALAQIIKFLTTIYDNLFETSFPYSMGWHGAPEGEDSKPWLLHAHYYPCLLRSKSIKKFMVGYELLAQPQRDLTPEQAAQKLRACLTEHYTVKRSVE